LQKIMKDRYINFFTDFGFKKLFGSEVSKDLLIDFLNELLRGKESPIVELTFKKTEHLGASELDRKAIFDLYCVSETGERFIVELQKAKQKYFKERSLFYATFPIQEQAEKGEWDFQLKTVYTVAILDFLFDETKQDAKYVHDVRLTEQETKMVFCDKLIFIYIEMPKFLKREEELVTQMDKWLFAIQNLSRLENVPSKLQAAVFQRFFELAEIACMSPEDRSNYEASLKYYRDMNNVVATAEEKGHLLGIVEGKQLGIVEGKQLGIVEGKELGAISSKQQDILEVLEIRFGNVPFEVRKAVEMIVEIEKLSKLLRVAIRCVDIEGFAAEL